MGDNWCLSQRWVTGFRDLDYYAVFTNDSDVSVVKRDVVWVTG